MAVSSLDAPGREVNVKELIDALLRSKLLMLLVTVAFGAAAFAAACIVPKKYEATIVISPVASSGGGGLMGSLSSVGSQFGGLASLAGITPQGDAKKSESLAVLQSEALTEQYIQRHDLLSVLYASQWDEKARRWKTPDPEKIPTLWKANKRFRDSIRSVTTDARTGLTTMKITWTNPELAARWANELVKLTNDFIRGKAIAESESNIAYLTSEAQKTSVVAVQQAIYAVLQNEISTEMVARGNDQFALKVVDPAFAPEVPSSPRPVLWAVLGLIAGLLTSFVLVLLTRL